MKKIMYLAILFLFGQICLGCFGSQPSINVNSVANSAVNSANTTPTPVVNIPNTNANIIGSNSYKSANNSAGNLENSNIKTNTKSSNVNTKPTPSSTPKTVDSSEKKDEGQFSFPPPQPTTYTLRQNLGNISANDYVVKLEEQLKNAGFNKGEFKFFSRDKEFAIVTRFEQIQENGDALKGDRRWSEEFQSVDGINKYAEYLVWGKKSYYRVWAFLVTNQDYAPESGSIVTFEIAKNWLAKGNLKLSEKIKGSSESPGLMLDDNYSCYVLIYIFQKHTSKNDSILLDGNVFNISAETQLMQNKMKF
jgi:hypothetical protein